MAISWTQLKAEFIDASDALRVTGRRTTGLMGLARVAPRAAALHIGDELRIEIDPDGDGYLLLLVEIAAANRTVCLVPRATDDTRWITAESGVTYPAEADPTIVLTEPTGVHTVYAAVTAEPLPDRLRERLCAELEGRNGDDLLDELARTLAAMPEKELHRRSVVVQPHAPTTA